MEKFSEFLVNNYVWFLVGAVILIFALIGYLVDTNNKKKIASGELIPKPKKERKAKSKEEETKESISEMENVPLGEAMKPKSKKAEEKTSKEEPIKENKEEVKKPETDYDKPIIKEEEPSDNSFEVEDR
ncbi:MAG TPA: hypothetical protein PLX66_02535 [Bacilli bacterium]|nr:hypothetical protein [Bacilli bacterium]